jgi:hypothetical protein
VSNPQPPKGVLYSRHDRKAPESPRKGGYQRALLIDELKHYLITGQLPKKPEVKNEK